MRSLEKNKRKFYYANLVGTEPLYDEYGNETGEVKKIYSDIEEARHNISANAGEEALNVFGSQTDYSRTIVTTSTNLKEKASILRKRRRQAWLPRDCGILN